VLQLVMDSLRYWAQSFHVDGFRFDLGVTLGREDNGFDPGSGFFDALRQDPALARVKMISEPWDLGPGGYQLGHHPTGFAEWNDRFRDSTRRFWRGDAGERPEFAARLAGSSDLFDRHARRPWASINYVASHDGFTLADVVRYSKRHNEANGEDNNDGASENYSANWGVEGSTADKAIVTTRLRVERAMLATVMFSHGTPMLLGGDEFGRTQRGNNNPYCQDNDISWWDWSLAHGEPGRALRAFVAKLIALRKAHPALRARHFFHGQEEPAPGIADIDWFDAAAQKIPDADWRNPEQRVLCLRRATRNDDASVSLLSFFLNPTAEDREFRLAPPDVPRRVLVDTASPDLAERDVAGDTLVVAAHGAALVYSRLAGPTRP
jgi:glycogen operon protein